MNPSQDTSSPRVIELRESIADVSTLPEVLNTLPRSILERISANLGILDAPLAELPPAGQIRDLLVEHVKNITDDQIENVIESVQRFKVKSGVSPLVAARSIASANCKTNHPANALIALAIEGHFERAERTAAPATPV